jgi:hypothetical protein
MEDRDYSMESNVEEKLKKNSNNFQELDYLMAKVNQENTS